MLPSQPVKTSELTSSGSSHPAVAVLMATYKGDDPEHLALALSSLRQQTYPTTALHIYLTVDGPIPPENETVLADFSSDSQSPKMTVIRLAKNGGLAAALNEAAAQMQDEAFVLRADADDVNAPNRTAEQIGYLQKHADVDILGSAIEEFSADGGVLGIRNYPPKGDVIRYIQYASPLAHPSVCFRRAAWIRIGGYRQVAFNEDLDMWFRALAMGLCIDNLSQPLVRYRINSTFFSRRSWAKAFAEFGCYTTGIKSLYGWSWRLITPLPRLAIRLAPTFLTRFFYAGSNWRRRLLNRRDHGR
jgi:glycosyltransferase involved in cell wall biosynthesis